MDRQKEAAASYLTTIERQQQAGKPVEAGLVLESLQQMLSVSEKKSGGDNRDHAQNVAA